MRLGFELIVSLLLAALVDARLFGAKMGVPELSARNFKDQVLYNGNVSAVLFYAPWCGHCQNLASEWKKSARELKGIARVVAVDCDADINKPLCAKYKVQSFPTIKVFQPAKLTDVDWKNFAAENKPLPKRRPKMFTYNGARDSESIKKFIVNHLRNYVALLDGEESLKWLAPNHIPRVVMLPGKKYKSRQVSPLLKTLSREYFGKVRFAMIPRRIDGAWNLMGMQAPDKSQLVYMSDDKTPVVYKGSMKKRAIKQFVDEQYELEQSRRRRAGHKIERDDAANGLEFVVEDQQPEQLEHIRQQEELRKQQIKQMNEVHAAAFAKYGKEMPSELITETESIDSTSATPVATAMAEENAEVEEAEDFEFSGDEKSASADEDEDEEGDEDAAGQQAGGNTDGEGEPDVSLDATIIDVAPDQIVVEGPEAVSSYLAEREAKRQSQLSEEQAEAAKHSASSTEDSAKPQPTPEKRSAGIFNFDTFVSRCIRPGYNCVVLLTDDTHNTRDDDLLVVINAMERISMDVKKRTLFEYTSVEEASDDLKEFYEDIGAPKVPSLLWWDIRRQKLKFYDQGWTSIEVARFVERAFNRKIEAEQDMPSKYLYWLTKDEVQSLDEKAKRKRAKDEL